MEGERRKPKRRGKRRRAEPVPVKQADAPPAASGQVPPHGKRKQPQPPFPQSKRRKRGGVTSSQTTSSSFLNKMRARLSGGHFRMLNEKLYTCSGSEAFEFFKEYPELFDAYHAGYGQQMSRWPEQPVNVIIKWLQSHSPALVVADFGCGNASLARSVKNKVFSIDLVSMDPSVIACDMANCFMDLPSSYQLNLLLTLLPYPYPLLLQTPLDSLSVDVSVFCLSLMGVNFPNYLVEANRVLRPGGWLLIAEVRSRLDPATGGADPDKFCNAVQRLGFSIVSRDFSNKMFVLFYFRKKKEAPAEAKGISWPELKPCLYKRR